MNFAVFILLLFQSIYTFGFSVHSTEDCVDFTLGDCTINIDEDNYELHADDVRQCQEICHGFDTCYLFSYDESRPSEINCKLLNHEYRKSCNDVGASLETQLDICNSDSIQESCEGFDEENCNYFEDEPGSWVVDIHDGDVADAEECQTNCQTFSSQGCKFWVYRGLNQSCHLLRSGERHCHGLSGPRTPDITTCPWWEEPTTTKKPSCSSGTEFMGNCYEVSEDAKAWDVAAQDCSARGGALTSILNDDENAFLANLVGHNRAWIGGYDTLNEDDWKWANGDEFTYTNWAEEHPDGGRLENCLDIDVSTYNGKWNDMRCDLGYKYICQFPMTVFE